jgi:phosphoribosylformylglycinamidine synthase subunit PurQ / glutaminase
LSKKIGVLRFPGTNCDRDVIKALESVGHACEFVWHKDAFDINKYDGFVIPGGFSYGDYLRSGALAARSKVISGLRQANEKGMPILGICNGFQILCETGLLPGVLLKNKGLRFVDKWVRLKKQNDSGVFAKKLSPQMTLPVAHGDGCFYADTDTLKKIEDDGLVALRYVDNPNGSLNDIAGVKNKAGNILGLMPHPERAMTDWMLGAERAKECGQHTAWGRNFFEAFG